MRNGVEVVAIRSDGRYFKYEDSDWGILELEGIDFPDTQISKEPRGFGHGDIITGKRKGARDIKLVAQLRDSAKHNLERNRVIGFHNSNFTFDLRITYLGETKIARACEIYAQSYPSGNVYTSPALTVMFLSPDADLYALNTDITSFISINPMWHAARWYEGSSGKLAFGEITKTTEKVVNYLGSEPAPIVVTVKATGYVDGIDVAIGPKKLRVSTKLYAGDTLVIDAEERIVTKNGTPVPQTDYDTWLLMGMLITYGDNTVKVYSGSNTAFTAEVSYIGRYGGL